MNEPPQPGYLTLQFPHVPGNSAVNLIACLSGVMDYFSPDREEVRLNIVTEREKQAAVEWFVANYRNPAP